MIKVFLQTLSTHDRSVTHYVESPLLREDPPCGRETYPSIYCLPTLTSHHQLVRHIGLQPVDFIHFCHVNLPSLAFNLLTEFSSGILIIYLKYSARFVFSMKTKRNIMWKLQKTKSSIAVLYFVQIHIKLCNMCTDVNSMLKPAMHVQNVHYSCTLDG